MVDNLKFDIVINSDHDDVALDYNDYYIRIYTNTLTDVFPNPSMRLIEAIREYYELDKEYELGISDEYRSAEEIIEIINSNLDQSLDIYINEYDDSTIEEINKYLPKNSNITVNDENIRKDFILKNSFRDDLTFSDKYNKYSDLQLDEMRKTMRIIEGIKRQVEKYDFSNLEKIIFISDIIRKKIYKDNEVDVGISRDIYRLFTDDYIVCEGYANLLELLCKELGIFCEKQLWDSLNYGNGHATNLLYIDDDKYNIHNLFEVDLTAHSKREGADDYLYDYRLFRTLNNARYISREKFNYEMDKKGTVLGKYIERVDRYNRMKEFGAPSTITEKEIELIHNSIEDISEKVGKKFIPSNDIYDDISMIDKICNTEMNSSNLLSAVYAVRRVEHLLDRNKYKLELDTLSIIDNRINEYNEAIQLLKAIFGEENTFINLLKNDFLNDLDGTKKEKLEKDIARIKVLSYMKSELKNKQKKMLPK